MEQKYTRFTIITLHGEEKDGWGLGILFSRNKGCRVGLKEEAKRLKSADFADLLYSLCNVIIVNLVYFCSI